MLSANAFAGELLDPKALFSGDAEVCFSDGSSLYIFRPHGKFSLEPLGISGRTIKGTWKYDSDGLHISGTWSWINGMSIRDDRREMDIHVGHVTTESTDHKSAITGKTHKVQKAYFLIERVQKTTKG